METKLCYPMFFWQPSASSVNAEPGIEAVVEAVVDYREWLEDKVSPAMSFIESSWLGLIYNE